MDEEAALERALAAWTAGIEAFIDVLAPDVEWYPPPGFPEGDVWRGREAVASILREVWDSVLQGRGVEVHQVQRGPHRWMLSGRQAAAHESGMNLEWEEYVVFELNADGLIRKAWVFTDLESARRQAGV